MIKEAGSAGSPYTLACGGGSTQVTKRCDGSWGCSFEHVYLILFLFESQRTDAGFSLHHLDCMFIETKNG